MNTLEEIENMLLVELLSSSQRLATTKPDRYFNALLGDTSSLIAGYIDEYYRGHYADDEDSIWFDDCLLINVEHQDNQWAIWGVLIWGRENTTEQWVYPFYLETTIVLLPVSAQKLVILFGDMDLPVLTYEEYSCDRIYWDGLFYNSSISPHLRKWDFVIAIP
jgi:hypothetical protein